MAGQGEMLTGAAILVKCLQEQKVDTLFGYPGGAVLYIYDEIFRAVGLKHILARHEQGAVHAADGYARSSGKVGVALVTSGPGATNAVTGLATANMDSIPLVCISGQVPTPLIGNDAFQEADTVGITRSCTKHNYLVKDVRDLARTIREAFYIAASGRPGPVLVDIPKDITSQTAEYFPASGKVDIPSYRPTLEGNARQIVRALELIASSRRLMIYTGGGVILSNASKELNEFVQELAAPITHTLMGLGATPASSPLFLGMLGMHGTYEANMAVSHCDVLLAIGARFDDRVTGKIAAFAPDAKIIHIDVDPTSISKNVRVDIPIVGDVRHVLRQMNRLMKEERFQENKPVFHEWWQQIQEWRGRECLRYPERLDVIQPQFVIQTLHRLTGGRAIVATDVGQHQMWSAQYYPQEYPRHWLTSGGLGTMGYGLPAALGAQAAFPDKLVILISGEGSIQMNMQEMATALQYKLPVKIAILNNGYLGMVRQWQEFFYDRRYSQVDMSVTPDFLKLADAFGAVGFRAHTPDQVEPVIRQALATPGLVVMDFHVNREANVYPMVPAGAGLTDMILL